MFPLYRRVAIITLPLIVAFLASRLVFAAENPEKVVYQWNPANFPRTSTNPWKGEPVTRPDGSTTMSTSGTGMGYNNYLVVPKGKLLSGHDYTAIIQYEIVTPTKFPDSFYIFARSSKMGQAQDSWRMWNGDPGDKGIAKLTISLKGNKASDDWMIYGGCKGPGTMIIDSFKVIEGTGLEYFPATPGAKAVPASLPAAVKVPTGAQPFTIDPPAAKKGLKLSATDFGLKADDAAGPVSTATAEANFAAISKALKACKDQDASVLTIPPGVYRFGTRAAIPIVGLSDLTIDGQGAEFIFTNLHTGVEAISVQNCERLVIKNLKLDWDWEVTPIASLAKVVSVTEDNKSCVVTFPDLTEKEIEATRKAPWAQMIPFDAATLTRTTFERNHISVASVENVDTKTLKVNFKAPVPLREGATYCVRHLYYDFGCFKIGFSNNLVFDNVIIYSIPGMGWFGTGDMRNWKLVNCKITRREGSRRPLTTAADGFHVSQSQGNLVIENCEFTGSGDDSINIHDNCFQGVQRVDDTTLSLINCPPWRLRIQAGDKLELFRGDYAPLGFSSTVKSVVYKDKNTTVTLADTLPAKLSPLSIVLNRRYDTHDVRISNTTFHDTNGRSILLSSRNATIENCHFKNAVGTAIQLHTEIVGDLWAEGSGASNVVIHGNTFENTSVEGRYENAVVYSGAKMPIGVTSYPLFNGLLIEKNRFINSSGPAVSLFSAKNAIVRDNRLESPQPTAAANYLAGSLHTAYASDVVLSNNTWQSNPRVGKAGVLVDSSTTSKIVAKGNVVLGTP